MKTILPIITILFTCEVACGQIITPIVKANFGVDGELMSNYFNGAPQPAYDDWYSNSHPGTGQFIIDTTGAAAIVAGYTSNPATRRLSFSRIMRQSPYSTVNNRLLIDAIFHRDYHGSDSTVFATGSNKNAMTPANWSCPVAQGIPDKNDILDAFTHVRRAGPNVTDSMWMFSAISIENTSGSRYFDFELYQTDIYFDRTTRTFRNYGPDAGHTSWQFDAAGNTRVAGDIIFTAEFGGSALTMIEARIWVNRAALSITPTAFNWGGQFDGDGTGATFGYANIRPKTTGAFYTGLPCAANTWAGPFRLIREDNSMVTTYAANQFLEFSVNLTKLGIDPRQTINNACGSAFRRVLIKTRASASFTAELKDFVAPFRMFDYPLVDANTFISYFCEVFPVTTIAVQSPFPASVYTWTTTTGHIVGSSTGPSIQVDAPGTYYVTQHLHVQCPLPYSRDSMTLFFDPVCTVLDFNLIDVAVKKINNHAELIWKAVNNDNAASFNVEYSQDGQRFVALASSLPARRMPGTVDYSYSHRIQHPDAPVVYYRVSVTGKNGKTKYSEIVELRNDAFMPGVVIFPNPTQGPLWFSSDYNKPEVAKVSIWNGNGRLIERSVINIANGKSLIKITGLEGKPKGIYLLKIHTAKGDITKKILVN